MITLLFINSLVFASSFMITYKIFRFTNFINSLQAFFLFFCSQIVSTELLLGIFGILYLKNLILANILILLFVFLFSRRRISGFEVSGFKKSVSVFLEDKMIKFIFAAILAFALVKISINLINPPFGWDSLNYHFTFAVEWLKSGNLNIPIVVSDDPSPSYYPINGSLFYLWLILPLKSVFLADLGQVPFFIIAVLSVYGISRKIGLDKSLSFYSAALFLLIPNLFKQLQIAYVDVMVASLFLVCVNYLFLMNKSFNLQNVLIYSLSLGLLIGTKTIALPYSILLIIPFIVALFKNTNKINLILVLVLCILVCGAFSYLRNFIETGNPFYPLDFKIFNIHIFKGVMDKVTYSSHFRAIDYCLGKALFHEGLGAQSLLIILPAVFLALPVALIKKRKKLDFNLIYLFVLPILLYLVYRYIIPLANLRYLYTLMGIGIILGFYVLDILHVKKPFIDILVIICVLASMAELAKRQELVASIAVSFLFFFILLGLKRIKIFRSLFKNRYLLALFVAVIFCLFLVAEKYYKTNEYPRYYKMVKYSGFWPDATKAWFWLNENTSGNNIAYIGRPVPFPLYGTNFKNNVYYVSVNKTEPAKLHYFLDSKYVWGYEGEGVHKSFEEPNNYRGNADYNTWLNNLRQRNTDYLFVYSLHQIKTIRFPMEDAWAINHSEVFDLVFKNDTVHIYKIIR